MSVSISFWLWHLQSHIRRHTHRKPWHTCTQASTHSRANVQTHKSLTHQRRTKQKAFPHCSSPFLDQMTQAITRRRTHLLSSAVLIICYHRAETTNAPLMAIILLSAVSHCGWRADTQSHLACRAEIPQHQLNWILKCCVYVRVCVHLWAYAHMKTLRCAELRMRMCVRAYVWHIKHDAVRWRPHKLHLFRSWENSLDL